MRLESFRRSSSAGNGFWSAVKPRLRIFLRWKSLLSETNSVEELLGQSWEHEGSLKMIDGPQSLPLSLPTIWLQLAVQSSKLKLNPQLAGQMAALSWSM